MFEPSETPHIFGVPPGADYPQVLAEKVLTHYAKRPPQDLARLRILVNTRRMQRRLKELFRAGKACLLPRIGLITDVDALNPGGDLPPPISLLRRRLELAQLTARLIDREPDLAARSAAVDLAESLALLLDEMQGEGVAPESFSRIEVGDDSRHWERSLKFLQVAGEYTLQVARLGMDSEARRRLAIEQISATWQAAPARFPVIVAGSTGSRAATSLLMRAVARLPQGALVLPGFDFDLPDAMWDMLASSRDMEDHPQYRFAALLASLNLGPNDVHQWGAPPEEARNSLISMSLRPAHVTDQWLSEGPDLGDLRQSTRRISLIEAPNQKSEALAIAVALREAVHQGKNSALVTPDLTLARRVAAVLSRWNIVPDDSAGTPLSLTPPGRFLRQVAGLVGRPVLSSDLIALLKHPLTRTGSGDRPAHLEKARAFELFLRHRGIVRVSPDTPTNLCNDCDSATVSWASWVSGLLQGLDTLPAPTLKAAVRHHISLAEAIAQGSGDGSGLLWETGAGQAVQKIIQAFQGESDFGGFLPFADYLRFLENALAAESERDSARARPDVMIWGTLEARVQGADRVILGGLIEGQWPMHPRADPWLNRRMRRDLGLLLPEREIGLAAHDYQQAVAASDVIIAHARRGEDGDTVPSRWLNRLTNLLGGLPAQNGPDALADMRERGEKYLGLAKRLDVPGLVERTPFKRPAPAPPARLRPKTLSVTEIQTIIRDPYAIYAKHVLGLRLLPPVDPRPDARLKGIVFHKVLEEFFAPEAQFTEIAEERARLANIIQLQFEAAVPWRATRVTWAAELEGIADWLFETERTRRGAANLLAREVKGNLVLPGATTTIKGTADRIDACHDGSLAIYDYKTGTPPALEQIRHFDKQLLIEAVMADAGAFRDVGALPVSRVGYIKIGRTPKIIDIELEGEFDTVTIKADLAKLLEYFSQEDTGYISRRAMEKMRFVGDYDHLARYGEWDATQSSVPEPVR